MNVLPTKPAGDTTAESNQQHQQRRKVHPSPPAHTPETEDPIQLKEPFSIAVRVDGKRGVLFRIVDGTTGEVVREVSPEELRSVGNQIIEYLDLRKQRFHHEIDQRG